MEIEDFFTNLPTIETNRLILRKLTLADAEDMFEYASDPEVPKYSAWSVHKSIDDTKNFLEIIMEEYNNHAVSSWGIIHKADQKLIGTCGFSKWIIDDDRAEIGYALSRKYWRQGYMTEAVRTVIDFGFGTMLLNRIEARCKTQNIASAKVMEKVGMKFEGILRQQMFYKGKYHDMKMYSILSNER